MSCIYCKACLFRYRCNEWHELIIGGGGGGVNFRYIGRRKNGCFHMNVLNSLGLFYTYRVIAYIVMGIISSSSPLVYPSYK